MLLSANGSPPINYLSQIFLVCSVNSCDRNVGYQEQPDISVQVCLLFRVTYNKTLRYLKDLVKGFSEQRNILATCPSSIWTVCQNFNEYKLLLFGHRNLMRNTTQTAVINIFKDTHLVNLSRFVSLSTYIFKGIAFGKIFILQNIWNLNRDDLQ